MERVLDSGEPRRILGDAHSALSVLWREASRVEMKEWYERLYALGFDDPGEQDIPEEFNSDEWWRKD